MVDVSDPSAAIVTGLAVTDDVPASGTGVGVGSVGGVGVDIGAARPVSEYMPVLLSHPFKNKNTEAIIIRGYILKFVIFIIYPF